MKQPLGKPMFSPTFSSCHLCGVPIGDGSRECKDKKACKSRVKYQSQPSPIVKKSGK